MTNKGFFKGMKASMLLELKNNKQYILGKNTPDPEQKSGDKIELKNIRENIKGLKEQDLETGKFKIQIAHMDKKGEETLIKLEKKRKLEDIFRIISGKVVAYGTNSEIITIMFDNQA